ncbi:HEAT repeat domain-containing protein [Scytonema hofmannii FACHB-248]|uniref:HEAT repeat domain-containing protein n=1 Tax=Scytonema hofmannii FACHB-248 TaxID=1842502 RepID=A0ABR8GMV6_9CYAN|nr:MULTISPECIES: peptidoglycan-binding protein [Nostocales]MBD2604400.1 HEAT repeat domain-containing protein [Scytonema hofmannii FACHB-248]
MRLRHSSILVITCLTCLGFDPNPASTATPNLAPEFQLQIVNSTQPAQSSILELGSRGVEVEALQKQLKELGYYYGVVNGDYGDRTKLAVSKFQKAKNLIPDGIAGVTTRNILLTAVKQKQSLSLATIAPNAKNEKTSTKASPQKSLLWWSLVGIGILGGVGALLYLLRRSRKVKQVQPENFDFKVLTPSQTKPVPGLLSLDSAADKNADITNTEEATAPSAKEVLPLEKTSRLAKVNIVEELMKDLRSPDPTKRRKAIWDLGQQGDSRAIQPLIEVMIDADSQQRSLILAALAEIGTRTLKPMNRALAISLQDESPEVRQNAIRDLTRVYDMMAQISQMLCLATEDPNAEVQATARYALSQMNRIRTLSHGEKSQEEDSQLE